MRLSWRLRLKEREQVHLQSQTQTCILDYRAQHLWLGLCWSWPLTSLINLPYLCMCRVQRVSPFVFCLQSKRLLGLSGFSRLWLLFGWKCTTRLTVLAPLNSSCLWVQLQSSPCGIFLSIHSGAVHWTPPLHLLSSSFPWCFSISRLPLCPSPLTPPPCCTPCSLTLPARRLEIELDSVLTPVRAREQETNGVSGESRQPASSVSGWNNGIRHVVVCRCVKVPDQTFLNYSMCNIKLNSSLHTKLQLIHILTYISEFN